MQQTLPATAADPTAERPYLSVVVPAYNEEESLRPMHAALLAALEPWGKSFEIIYVDDGSRDRSVEVLRELAADPRVGVVAFRRNFGLRIDHVLASTILAQRCTACAIDKSTRGLERPSDHAPVIATFG